MNCELRYCLIALGKNRRKLHDCKTNDADLPFVHCFGWHLPAALVHLSEMTNLKCLALCGTQVTDAGLSELARSTTLEELWLNNTQITDAGLAHLKELTGMQVLGFEHTQVTDAGLAYLAGLTNLKQLSLDGTKITDKGVKSIQSLLPSCIVFRNSITRPVPAPDAATESN